MAICAPNSGMCLGRVGGPIKTIGWLMPHPHNLGMHPAVPDLDDWATVGTLLGMLDGLRLVQAPTILTPARVGWTIQWRRQGGVTYQTSDATLGEAVAAALLAAWGEP